MGIQTKGAHLSEPPAQPVEKIENLWKALRAPTGLDLQPLKSVGVSPFLSGANHPAQIQGGGGKLFPSGIPHLS
jgi:hypothetical protein